MGSLPYIKFYLDDWLGGTMGMYFRHQGAYLALLIYQAKNGPIGIDDVKHMLGCDFDCWDRLKSKFTTDDSGKFFNVKMQSVINQVVSYLESRKRNGACAKHKKSICSAHAEHMGDHTGSMGYGSVGSVSTSGKDGLSKGSENRGIVSDWIDRSPQRLRDAWAGYIEMRQRVRKPATPKAQVMVIEKLKELAGDNHDDMAAILNQSTMHSWQGVFPLRGAKSSAGRASSSDADEEDIYVKYGVRDPNRYKDLV